MFIVYSEEDQVTIVSQAEKQLQIEKLKHKELLQRERERKVLVTDALADLLAEEDMLCGKYYLKFALK
jgi:hypothetical protein